jgi:DNA-binding transcriptional regulator YhcF (GntR family)
MLGEGVMAPMQNLQRVFTIDFQSNIPYYVQLIDIIEKPISAGDWKLGTSVPGRLDFCSCAD